MRFLDLLNYILFFMLLASCSTISADRDLAALEYCGNDGQGCPFLNIGHRGSPHTEAENTIPAFKAALREGANALEIDLVLTAEGEVAVYHDRNPNEFVSIIRQSGLEGLKHIPHVPDIGSDYRVPTEKLTLSELRSFYGYALSKGFLGNVFTTNLKDADAIIPTLEEFSAWANEEKSLKAVFLDMKLVPGQENLAIFMANKFARAFEKSHYRLYMLTQYESIYAVLQKWIVDNPEAKNRHLTLDIEEDGALQKTSRLKDKLKRKVKSLSLGSTVLRRWKTYKAELSEILDRSRRSANKVYPIVSWTVDDEQKLYELLQMGVDGIFTNRPAYLNRLLNRHWKDHSVTARTLASCYQKAKKLGPWIICSSGADLAPLAPLGHREIRNWVCRENNTHPTLRDFYGCNGLFDKVNIKFNTKIENSSRIIIYTSPSGTVEVAKLPRTLKTDDQLIFFEYQQEKCRDGFLNGSCEYQMTVEYKISGKWTKYPGKAVGKDSFYHLIALPKATEDVRIHLVETDDGRPSVSRTVNTTLTNTVAVPIGHSNDFKGKIKLYARDSSAWLKDGGEEIVAIEYRQKKCYDGILNYNCEYSLKIEALKKDGRLHVMEGNEHFLNGSFMVFAQVPKDVIGLRLSLSEKDHRNLSASEEIYLDLRHGNSMDIRSWQGIFEGNFKIKFFDYDEAKYGAEGDTDFIPHKQRFREQIIYKFIP